METGFPFVSATIDARGVEGGAVDDNLIVRRVVLFLGDDTYACFDTDLFRLALVWQGEFLHYRSMAPYSYYNIRGKEPRWTKLGQQTVGEVCYGEWFVSWGGIC
ncbi:MAG: hypothetical protein M2R45_01896 [Verrucomicrobia subdivision 3 bacterium]|nr:hypothetical protein [Limisphaerales bacterium]MCS1415694.1 hypothetical protein [Limisphaerales bacterium]